MATDKAPKRKIVRRDVHGILLLDKPAGLSSNAALQRARYLVRARKGGHTGSLDPLATGMLPLCFGDATRFSHAMLEANKTYEVVARLGQSSSTGDAEGEKSPTVAIPSLDAEGWQAIAEPFIGEIQQVPPMYSALKQDGQRLYAIARQGKTVERPARTVNIFSLQIREASDERIVFSVSCSKGTYIRTLVEDMAKAAETLAWTEQLRRTSVAPFVTEMMTLEKLESLAEDDKFMPHLLPVESGIMSWPEVSLDADRATRFCHGQRVDVMTEVASHVRCYGPKGRFLGSGQVDSDGSLTPIRVMSAAQVPG
ncbi:MAG: tRNA pseudouridine(55) synthase TruB [Woeseiaceae bacterium]